MNPCPPNIDDATSRGQAIYTSRTLSVYDGLVLGVSNRWIWRCPTPMLEELYRNHLTENHLEAGVGTGYFLDRVGFGTADPRLYLMDINQSCLDATAQRIARFRPSCLRQNLLQPIEFDGPRFDSIGVNYVLHCLPGDLEQKADVFDHLAELLAPEGVLFGSTLLSRGVHRNGVARRLMAFYNRRGIFSNREDSLAGLLRVLSRRFASAHVRTIGCAAVFVARGYHLGSTGER